MRYGFEFAVPAANIESYVRVFAVSVLRNAREE